MNPFNYIHKSPHRNQLESYLRVTLPTLDIPILDIGSKNRRYDLLMKEKPVAVDLIENTEFDVKVGDVTNLVFPNYRFKSVVCVEVLEYVEDYKKAIGEIRRVLTKGGTCIVSIPFMYGFHQDKLRYTKGYLLELFKDFTEVRIQGIGNFYTIILDILRGKIIKIKFLPFKYFLYILYFPFILLVPLFRFSKDESYVSGYLIVAKK